MTIKAVTVVLDVDVTGTIQGYQVCTNLQDTKLQNPTLEQLFCEKRLFNCPSCNDDMELIMFISNLSTEVLSELEDNPVSESDITNWNNLSTKEPIEEIEADDDFSFGVEPDFAIHYDTQDYQEEIELKTDGTDDNKRHYRAVRIAKEQRALASEEFKCDNCQECFMYKAALMNHQKKCLNEDLSVVLKTQRDRIFNCSKCTQKFKSRAGMIIHERTCRGESVPFCVECNTEYRSQLALNKHIRAVHQPTLYHCDECGDMFKKKWLLDEHILKHTIAKPYICDKCNKSFSGKSAIKHHLLSIHSNDFQGHKCPVCKISLIYSTRSKLRVHLAKKHSNNERVCVSCCTLFSTANELQVHNQNLHEKLELEQLFYKCSHCDFTSTVRSTTENHQLSHVPSTQWPFACGTCGKRFKKKDNCKRHESIHTGEKNHSCDICGATFRLRYQVTQHMAVHRPDDKQFLCSVCKAAFKDRLSLKEHKLKHKNKSLDSDSSLIEVFSVEVGQDVVIE